MATWKDKTLDFDWKELTLTDDDWAGADRSVLRSMLQQLYLIREFETALLELAKQGLVHGPVHSSIGQEAVAVGAMAAIRPADGVCGTHRAHHQFLAKAYSYYTGESADPVTDAIGDDLQHSINTLLAEIMGLSAGCCGGRGGSMHLCDPKIGILGTNAIVGGGIAISVGAAWAQRYKKTGNVVVSFFGDGAVNQGVFHEALNLAGLWKAPVIFVLENNLYAVATSVEESAPIDELSIRASSYAMPARLVDGMDPLAVKIAIEAAAESLRNGGPPVFIEAATYRNFHHAGDIPGSAFGYRSKDEEANWGLRDPLVNFSGELRKRSLLSEGEDEHLMQAARRAVAEAVDFCTQKQAGGVRVIKPSLWPTAESLTEGLRGDGGEFDGIDFVDADDLACEREIKYVEAIAESTGRWMEKDPNVFVLGEEVGHMRGGAYMATKGLPQRFAGRVLDTPISEAGFTGLACGAAMVGLKPVVEIMFPDFALVAADQIFNQIAKLRHIYGNARVDIPLVMRTRIAIGCGYGGQHSMDPVGLFALFPGWRIVAPTTPLDYIGLFNSAMQSCDPVLIVEHHEFYATSGAVPPADNCDYFIRIGKARRLTEGGDITVLAYSATVPLVKRAADELADEGVGVELIDLRTLSMPDIDYETIGESLDKTNVLLIVEQAPRSKSIGPRIAGECQRRFFGSLDAPIATVAGADVPPPVSKPLEAAALPNVETVKQAVRKAVSREF